MVELYKGPWAERAQPDPEPEPPPPPLIFTAPFIVGLCLSVVMLAGMLSCSILILRK